MSILDTTGKDAKRKLMKRAKRQGLWPIPEQYHGLPKESLLRAWSDDTGHAIKYLRLIYDMGHAIRHTQALPPLPLVVQGVETYAGKAKFKSKPNPVVRAGVAKAAAKREKIHEKPLRGKVERTTIRTNGQQLARTARDFALVQTNGRMDKDSQHPTAYSTGYRPPSAIVKARFESPDEIKARRGHKRFSTT